MISTSGTNILATGINFIISLYLARLLGAHGRGEWTIIFTSIYFFVNFLCFGLNQSLVYQISMNARYQNAINLTIIVFCVSCGIIAILILTLWLTSSLDVMIPHRFTTKVNLACYYFWFVVLFANQLQIAILTGLSEFKFINFSNLLFFAFLFLFLLAVQLLEKKVILVSKLESVLYTYTGLSFLHFLLNFYYLRKHLVYNIYTFKIDIDFVFFTTSFYNFFATSLKYLVYRIDFWIVNHYLGASELGNYSLAIYLVQIIGLLSSSISTVLLTYLTKMNDSIAHEAISLFVSIFFSATLFLSVLAIPFFYYIVGFLYGEEFLKTATLSVILVMGMPFYTLLVILETYNISRGKTKKTIKSLTTGLIFSIITNVIVIEYFQIWGVAFVNVSTFIVISIMLMIQTKTLNSEVFTVNVFSKFRRLRLLTMDNR